VHEQQPDQVARFRAPNLAPLTLVQLKVNHRLDQFRAVRSPEPELEHRTRLGLELRERGCLALEPDEQPSSIPGDDRHRFDPSNLAFNHERSRVRLNITPLPSPERAETP
jgi:hypothetical protein